MNFISVGDQMKKSLKVVKEIINPKDCEHPPQNHEYVGPGENNNKTAYWFCNLCGVEQEVDPAVSNDI